MRNWSGWLFIGMVSFASLLACSSGDDATPGPRNLGAGGGGAEAGSGGAGGPSGGGGGSTGGSGGMGGMAGAAGGTRTVSWSFPALIPDPKRGLVFPTYLAHLLGAKITHKFPTDLACADLTNPGDAVEVSLVIRFPVYAEETHQNVRVPAGAKGRVCVKPTFDFAKLYAIRDATPGRIEVELRAGSVQVAAAMRNITIPAVNDIAWDAPGVPLLEMRELAPVFVTPKAKEIDQLQRLAAELSVWKGFGGGDPYKRAPYKRQHTLAANQYAREPFFVEDGETMSWKILRVAEGATEPIDVYLFTPAQLDAFVKGTSMAAAKVWKATQGSESSGQVPRGAYYLALVNQGPAPRTVEWTRAVTRHDVADDVLRSIYGALRKLNTKYSSIPGTYFEDWQHVRRAEEVLSALSANCIDGSLLFASTLELLGMEPVLVFKTGHAFVGVRAAPGSPTIWPVETTTVGTAEFDKALSIAVETFNKDSKSDPLFRTVDVKAMRARGVLPLPQ